MGQEIMEKISALEAGTFYYVEWQYDCFEEEYAVVHTATPQQAIDRGLNSPGQLWTYSVKE